MTDRVCTAVMGVVFSAAVLAAQQPAAPGGNTSVMEANGTVRITRVVPLSEVLSPEARKWMARPNQDDDRMPTLEALRAQADQSQARTAVAAQSQYPTTIVAGRIAGVPVKIVTPPLVPAAKRDRVLICLHAGAFLADWGSATESIPIASLTQTKVISVLYRLAPEHPFPAALDDVLAVYRDLLKTYRPSKIAIYGTSAGGVLTAELAVKLKALQLPLPGALGVFSAWGDFSRANDSLALYSLNGLVGAVSADCRECDQAGYVGATSRVDPILSPWFADVHGLPPTLFLTATRDITLSGTVLLHRKFLADAVRAELVVFEGLPHAFWAAGPRTMPEAIEANRLIAAFLDRELGGSEGKRSSAKRP